MTTTKRPTYVDEMASELNVDAQKLWEKLQAEAREGHVRLATEDDSIGASVAAFAQLGQFVAGQGRATDLPGATRAACKGLGRRLELRTFAAGKGPRRPTIEGFPEALFKYIAWLRDEPRAPEDLKQELPQLQFLYSQIAVKRPLLGEIDDFRDWLLGDLSIYERDAYDLFARGYGLIRAQVLQNRDWLRDLGDAEAYLFGAAKAGAETRAAAAGMRVQITEKVTPAAREAGVKEGERRVKDELRALLDAPGTGEDPKGGTRR